MDQVVAEAEAPPQSRVQALITSIRSRADALLSAIKQRLRRWHVRRSMPAVEDIVVYRRFALKLLQGHGRGTTALLASADRGMDSAQCCALLSAAIAGIVKKPILILDISPAGSVLPMFLGCSHRSDDSEGVSYASRDDRFFERDEGWFFNTREGLDFGPFKTRNAAQQALDDFVLADLAGRENTPSKSASQVIQATAVENVFYLSALSAGLQILLHNDSTDEAAPIQSMLSEVGEKYHHILIFGGHLLDSATSLKLASHVDSVILTSVENETTQGEFKEAINTLRMSGANSIHSLLIQVGNGAK